MAEFQLWTRGDIFRVAEDVEPQLASWDRADHPSQVRLREYLDGVADKLGPLDALPAPLFVHLDVDVRYPENLLKHHDLENYPELFMTAIGFERDERAWPG